MNDEDNSQMVDSRSASALQGPGLFSPCQVRFEWETKEKPINKAEYSVREMYMEEKSV